MNALLQQERVLTGSEPGLTRDAVRVKFEYEGETVYLVGTLCFTFNRTFPEYYICPRDLQHT